MHRTWVILDVGGEVVGLSFRSLVLLGLVLRRLGGRVRHVVHPVTKANSEAIRSDLCQSVFLKQQMSTLLTAPQCERTTQPRPKLTCVSFCRLLAGRSPLVCAPV